MPIDGPVARPSGKGKIMAHHFDIDDLILNYDPETPPRRFEGLGLEAMTASFDARSLDRSRGPARRRPPLP